MLLGILFVLLILGGIVMIAIKAFKFSFDDNHGCLLRIIAFLFACGIVYAIFGGN